MGWLSFILSQAITVSIALGALKRQGAITVRPEKIQNENARALFVKAVEVGENIAEYLQRLAKNLMSDGKRR